MNTGGLNFRNIEDTLTISIVFSVSDGTKYQQRNT